MDFIPNTNKDREAMLKEIGLKSISELFRDIPDRIILKDKLKIPASMSEVGLFELLKGISKMNKVDFSYFIGAGAYKHFIPSVVKHIVARSEFYTTYTPYQPEMSQGILQAIYEYQTMICNLFGMDVSNASLYDGATALAESCIMASNITKRNEILVSRAIHPDYRQVVKTYCWAHNLKFVEVDYSDGVTSIDDLKLKINKRTATLLLQQPNFFGCVENLRGISDILHRNGSLLNVCVIEPTSLGILKPPGEHSDIVVGEGQSLGNPVSFGGPYLGIMATKHRYLRQLPGRLVGKTTDGNGNIGYILTLQAREQHIRRERASSNICSNEALCALAATVYLSALGKNGLRKLAELCLYKAHYLADRLEEIGCSIVFEQEFYNEFLVKVKDAKTVSKKLLDSGILGGLDIGVYYPELNNCLLFCVTELNTKEEMDRLVEIIRKCN